jgi:hypothetical protein
MKTARAFLLWRLLTCFFYWRLRIWLMLVYEDCTCAFSSMKTTHVLFLLWRLHTCFSSMKATHLIDATYTHTHIHTYRTGEERKQCGLEHRIRRHVLLQRERNAVHQDWFLSVASAEAAGLCGGLQGACCMCVCVCVRVRRRLWLCWESVCTGEISMQLASVSWRYLHRCGIRWEFAYGRSRQAGWVESLI